MKVGGDLTSTSPTVTVTKVADCGPLGSVSLAILSPLFALCTPTQLRCMSQPAPAKTDHNPATLAVVPTGGGPGTLQADCGAAAPAGTAGADPTAVLRARVIKLLPHPAIGTAPPGGVSLVNIETLTWLDTTADRNLGTARLLGHRVALRAHLQSVTWQFGDRTTTATHDPGRPYTPSDPCHTAQCPHYFGHTYRHTGAVTIAATITWTGQFRIDTGAWQDIPGTVTAPAADTTLRIKQARSILIANPGNR